MGVAASRSALARLVKTWSPESACHYLKAQSAVPSHLPTRPTWWSGFSLASRQCIGTSLERISPFCMYVKACDTRSFDDLLGSGLRRRRIQLCSVRYTRSLHDIADDDVVNYKCITQKVTRRESKTRFAPASVMCCRHSVQQHAASKQFKSIQFMQTGSKADG